MLFVAGQSTRIKTINYSMEIKKINYSREIGGIVDESRITAITLTSGHAMVGSRKLCHPCSWLSACRVMGRVSCMYLVQEHEVVQTVKYFVECRYLQSLMWHVMCALCYQNF